MVNPCQREAVEDCAKRLLIIAGAGTGKTFTVIEKIAYMINAGHVDYSSVTATTFTNKAAGELRERLVGRFGVNAYQISIGTFHSLALDILQQNSGLDKSVTILSSEAQLKLIADLIEKNRIFSTTATKMVDKIQKSKEGLNLKLMAHELKVIELYNNHLKANKMVDFSDLILLVLELWQEKPTILAECQARAKLLCVDEYQDLSYMQHRMVSAMVTRDSWLVCVGDPDQAIYAFRGANCEYIMDFTKYFPGATITKLECNYRSGREIIDAANRLIQHNKARPQKNLYPFDLHLKASVEIKSFSSAKLEAEHIATKLNSMENLAETAILVRNRSQMIQIGEALSAAGISFITTGGAIERAEVKDLKAHMILTINPQDEEAFRRAILSAKNGIGKATVEKIIQAAKDSNSANLLEVIKIVAGSMRQQGALLQFVKNIETARSFDMVGSMAKFFLKSDFGEGLELVRRANLERWIEFLPNASPQAYFKPKSSDGVSLMTIHASKGLEFDAVFLPCWEEGVLPYHGAIGMEIEEERRLAYVALTRARKYVMISYSTTRVVNNKMHHIEPSIFINELRPKTSFPERKMDVKAKLEQGKVVFHPQYGKGKVVECGANAVMVKFFSGNKLVMIEELV